MPATATITNNYWRVSPQRRLGTSTGCVHWRIPEWPEPEDNTFRRTKSRRRFGVEIETNTCPRHKELYGHYFGCCDDCSINGEEFPSSILRGDAGFAVIDNFCKEAKQRGATVNRSCGLHVHIEVARGTSSQARRIAYAYAKSQYMWWSFVTSRRAASGMCEALRRNPSSVRECREFDYYASCGDKFEWLNVTPYNNYGTFEIRLHHGSLNAKKICNWVSLHMRFMDAVQDLSYDKIDELFGGNAESCWESLKGLISNRLLKYWLRIIKTRRPDNDWEI